MSKVAKPAAGADAPKPKAEVTKHVDKGLIKVHKDGKTLAVHPTCVQAHCKIGWVVVPGQSYVAPEPDPLAEQTGSHLPDAPADVLDENGLKQV